VLARGGPAAAARVVHRPGVLILGYHNVVPARPSRVGDGSLHLAADAFRRQLDLVQRWLNVAPLAELVTSAPTKQTRVVITFDDAYRGAVTIALAEMRDRGIPATMFVAPGRLGGDQFWWDTLAHDGELPPHVRQHAIEELHGAEDRVRAWAQRTGLPRREVPEEWRTATAEELATAIYPGLTLGSHSWSHPNLARLRREELDRELRTAHDWVASRFAEAAVPWVAYPYGRFSPAVCEAARAQGLAGGLKIEGGWTRFPLADSFMAPRLNVPAGVSADGFLLRISGLVGA
jgi:peptidoglycan/xylan/chitin deacetylase (PgdA/CDA1 family)